MDAYLNLIGRSICLLNTYIFVNPVGILFWGLVKTSYK